jgi:hypothetical protein
VRADGPALRAFMKKTSHLLLASLLAVACLAADSPPKDKPHLKAVVTCFNGKLGSGSSCSATCFQPDGTLHRTGKMTCGWPGKVSELEWSFVKTRDTNDVYRFTRRFPSDTPAATVTSKLIEFGGSRLTVFEDKHQVIVLEGPRK